LKLASIACSQTLHWQCGHAMLRAWGDVLMPGMVAVTFCA
jgi:hypothetical protein